MAAKKKRAAKKVTQVAFEASIPKLKLSAPLDQAKIAAIQRCLKKGQLTITLSRVDLASGRLGDGWLYD
jgi:hypothetical protein